MQVDNQHSLDKIIITSPDGYEINISREGKDVFVEINDTDEGSSVRIVLGQDGMTHRL